MGLVENIKLLFGVDGADKVRAAGRDVEDLEKKVARAGRAGEGSGGKLRGFGQTVQGLGRSFQDYVQGGLAGVINNIEQVTLGLGKLVGLAPAVGAALGGILTVAGSLLLVAGPSIKAFFDGLIGGSHKLPAVDESLAGLQERLGKIRKEFDELKDKPTLTTRELNAFLELRAKQADVEERIARAKEAQATADKLAKIRPDEESERGRILSEGLAAEDPGAERLRKALGGFMAEASRSTAEDLSRRKWEIRDQAQFRPITAREAVMEHELGRDLTPEEKMSEAQKIEIRNIEGNLKRLDAALKQGADGFRDEAQALIERAMEVGPGQLDAFRQIERAMGRRPGDFGPGLIQALGKASPEQMALEREGEAQAGAVEARRKQAEEADRKDAEFLKDLGKELGAARPGARMERPSDAELERMPEQFGRAQMAEEDAHADAAKAARARAVDASVATIDRRDALIKGVADRFATLNPSIEEAALRLRALGAGGAEIAGRLTREGAGLIRRSDPTIGPADATAASYQLVQGVMEQIRGQVAALNAQKVGTDEAILRLLGEVTAEMRRGQQQQQQVRARVGQIGRGMRVTVQSPQDFFN